MFQHLRVRRVAAAHLRSLAASPDQFMFRGERYQLARVAPPSPANLPDEGPTGRAWEYLWVLDTERDRAHVWSMTTGRLLSALPSSDPRGRGGFVPTAVKIADNLGVLNRAPADEVKALAAVMQRLHDDYESELALEAEDGIPKEDVDLEVEGFVRERFRRGVLPRLRGALARREVPAGWKPLRGSARTLHQQEDAAIVSRVFDDLFTHRAIRALVEAEGFEDYDPQTLDWVRQDLLAEALARVG